MLHSYGLPASWSDITLLTDFPMAGFWFMAFAVKYYTQYKYKRVHDYWNIREHLCINIGLLEGQVWNLYNQPCHSISQVFLMKINPILALKADSYFADQERPIMCCECIWENRTIKLFKGQ